MIDKDELLESIKPGMDLTKRVFWNIYSYELIYPGYAEEALCKLEKIGCMKARVHYASVVKEFMPQSNEEGKTLSNSHYAVISEQQEEKVAVDEGIAVADVNKTGTDFQIPEAHATVCNPVKSEKATANSAKGKKSAKFAMVNAKELLEMDIPDPEYAVEGLLPIGVCLFGGPPKSYKSYMCLDMCLCICQGRDFLGFETQKSACLYLDLESSERRPRYRIKQILNGEDAPDNLYIVTKSPKMGKGFEDSIRETVKEHPDIKVVVVDVFRYIRPPRGRNVDPYEKDYEDYSAVKALAEELRLAIILVTHTTKMKHPDDPFNELTGSAGTMGSVDMAMVIKKDNRDSKTAKLYITGRDLEERCYEMSFNKDSFRWEKHGSTEEVTKNKRKEEYEKSPVVNTIRMLVAQNNGRWEGSVSNLISASKCGNGMEIGGNVAKVGKEIRHFSKDLYEYDAIAFRGDRSGEKRIVEFKYIFPAWESTPQTAAAETVAVTDADINT